MLSRFLNTLAASPPKTSILDKKSCEIRPTTPLWFRHVFSSRTYFAMGNDQVDQEMKKEK